MGVLKNLPKSLEQANLARHSRIIANCICDKLLADGIDINDITTTVSADQIQEAFKHTKLSGDEIHKAFKYLIKTQAKHPFIVGSAYTIKMLGFGSVEVRAIEKVFEKELATVITKVVTKEPTIPAGFFLDLCLPPDGAELTRVGLQDVYERRWLKRYTPPIARALCCVHAISIILGHHGSKISKFIAMVLGLLGFKKLTAWFSGS